MATLLSKFILLALLLGPAPATTSVPKPTMFTVPIMVYHHIGSRRGIFYVSSDRFEQELNYLVSNSYNTIPMTQYGDYLEKGTPLPNKSVVLTFDDGYEDAYTTAFPILKAH